MSSMSPTARISLKPGEEYEYIEVMADWGSNRPCLWRIAKFERGGRLFYMGEAVLGGKSIFTTDHVPGVNGTYDPLNKAEEKGTWMKRTARECSASGCHRGQPLTTSTNNVNAECYQCQARYVESCVFCEAPDPAHYMWGIRVKMLKYGVCFRCLHWWELISKEKESIRVNGEHYMLGKNQPGKPNDHINGFGGRKFVIRYLDGRPDVTTYNLWSQGKIFEKFREHLPDNAEFVSD